MSDKEKYPYKMNPDDFLAIRSPVQEYIQDELDARQWSYVTFAEEAKRSLDWVTTMLKGETVLSEEDAKSIEKAFGIRASLWLSLDRKYAKHKEALNIRSV